ncbi:MAG: hypothetical protein QXI19_06020, partial [Candidatus Caldarchaeum sp.]
FQYERISKRADLQKHVWEAFTQTIGDKSWVIRYVGPVVDNQNPTSKNPLLGGEELAQAVEKVFEVNP